MRICPNDKFTEIFAQRFHYFEDPFYQFFALNLSFQGTSYSLALKYSSFLLKFFSFAFYNINLWFKICPKISHFSQNFHSRGNTGYRYRLSVSLQYRVSVSIKHVFVHCRYKYLDTVFEHDQSYQVLTACSFTVSEECEMKLTFLIDSKRRSVRKFLLSLAYLQLFRNAIEGR